MEVIGKIKSVCPKCLKIINAEKIVKDEGIYLVKTCEEHGTFETIIWEDDKTSYDLYGEKKEKVNIKSIKTEVNKGCPYDCGLCKDHEQNICCVLMEVTNRCNMNCPICFANSNSMGVDIPLEKISYMYDKLMEQGGPFNIQLSGGEPTVRDDLKEIIQIGKSKGFDYFQLNTNGLRIADDINYLKELKDAGLNCVFLQFDSFDDKTYEKIRGMKLINKKFEAILNCKKLGIGVVLVPVIVPDLNENEVGKIIEYAFKNLPFIRGVHFQPVSFFGRIDTKNFGNIIDKNSEKRTRITIPRILRDIEKTTNGVCKVSDFVGGGAENSYCSFHANYYLDEKGNIKLLKGQSQGDAKTSDNSRCFVKGKWGYDLSDYVDFDYKTSDKKTWCEDCHESSDNGMYNFSSLDKFLERVEKYTLAVSGMIFQDAYNFDIERVKRCYIMELLEDGRTIPFCAYNLTSDNGDTLYRGK